MTITELTITLGQTLPHPSRSYASLSYASLRADVTVRATATDGPLDAAALRERALAELRAAMQRLRQEAMAPVIDAKYPEVDEETDP